MGQIERKAVSVSVAVNAVLFIVLGSVSLGGCLATPKEEVIPMEFLVVTEENAADRLAEEPNDARDPEPEPPKPDPIPQPEPPPPPPPVKAPDPIPPPQPKRPEPPKPQPPKKEEAKAKPKPPEPPKKPRWKPTPVKISKVRVGPVTTGRKDSTKAATQKALSQADIRKAFGAGAKAGNRNQTPANEASRCYGIIAGAFRAKCNAYGLESSPTGRDPVLTVTFGAKGGIREIKVKTSSGDRGYDGQVFQACRQVRRVDGLSDIFLKEYPTVDIRLSVE